MKTLAFKNNEQRDFVKTLNQRVMAYFKENNTPKTGNRKLFLKTAIILAIYFVPYFIMLTVPLPFWGIVLVYTSMFFGMSSIGFNIMHDACHGSFSEKKWVNRLMSYSLSMVGGFTFNWKIQHNVFHHTYTNVYELDEDIDDKPFLKLSPLGKHRKYHKYQYIYAPLLYGLATLSWAVFKDFKQLVGYNKSGMTEKRGEKPGKMLVLLLLNKIFYFGYTLGIPILLGLPWQAVLLGFLFMHILSGIYITVVFQLAHLVEGPEHHDVPLSGSLDSNWAVHQLKTTSNFATDSKVVGWLVGGLNFQVEHHLFPYISHIHYPSISKIVKKTAQEFEVPYFEFKELHKAIASHFKVLKMLGSPNSAQMAVA